MDRPAHQLSSGVPELRGREAAEAGEDQTEAVTAPGAHLQQIAFKNLVQRNRQAEQQARRPPPPNSVIHLPFIIVNTSRKTVIDCSISNDKFVLSGPSKCSSSGEETDTWLSGFSLTAA